MVWRGGCGFAAGEAQYAPTRAEQKPELQKVTLDDARKFHDQFYGANYGVFAVVGPVVPADIQKTAAELLGALGWRPGWTLQHIILPVGISFYTFQSISYSVSVYRGLTPATDG